MLSGFVLPVLEYFAEWCSAADTHHKLLDRAISIAWFLTRGVFEYDIHIVDLWHTLICECCIRSDETQCTLLMVLYLDRVCQCGLHAMPWSHFGMYMRASLQNLAVVHDFHSPVPMVFDCPKLHNTYNSLLLFSLSLLSVYRLVLWDESSD